MIAALLGLVLAQERPSPDWLPVLDAPRNVTHRLAIPKPVHAGEPLVLQGRVLRADRKTPVAGVVLYFHHTDARGIYPRPAGADPKSWSYWHGTLRGWLKTDSQGRYVLRTTRPAPYPGGNEPAHIHVYGLMPGSRTGFYLSDFVFQGDKFVNADYWRRVRGFGQEAYGGVKLVRDKAGVWQGTRDLSLPKKGGVGR